MQFSPTLNYVIHLFFPIILQGGPTILVCTLLSRVTCTISKVAQEMLMDTTIVTNLCNLGAAVARW